MVATRFAVAAHIMLLLAAEGGRTRTTSLKLARSVNTNPVVVRRITGQLGRAGLIRVHRGPGGAELARPAAAISLRDVWRAVNARPARPLLPIHNQPDPDCPVGHRVRGVLATAFGHAEAEFEAALARLTLDQLSDRLREPAEGIEAA
ncbi:MAG: Rrf2 family transcriptional regulator [Acetobacteraceae bacterium]